MNRKIIFSVGEYYHLYNRGVEKRLIFLDQYDRQRFILSIYLCNSNKPADLGCLLRRGLTSSNIFKLNREEKLVYIGAWCLMPNHFHILLKEKVEGGIALFMQKLLTSYTMYFNAKYQRTGSLFGGSFKAKHIDSDVYLNYLYAYIHLNPIGIIDQGWKDKRLRNRKVAEKFITEYAYSSYLDWSGCERDLAVILNKEQFPVQFKNKLDFNEMLLEWIHFDENEV